jgi:hypothetical protein
VAQPFDTISIREQPIYGVPESMPVRFQKTPPTEQSAYPGFAPGTTVHKAGSVLLEGRHPLPVDVREDRDVAVTLRDGTTIYVDVFRPTSDGPVPAILAWSPYGKRGGKLNLDLFGHPTRMDVPIEWEDGLNKFEGVNPSYWVSHGYAVVNSDSRGVFRSEGDLQFFGAQDALDEYDTIEWIAEQSWSTGKVALTGNSFLAIAQWFVAALRPPHLVAIAPWEGSSDIYRDSALRGGIPDVNFSAVALAAFTGGGFTEDMPGQALTHPLYDQYWASKSAALEEIEVPAYIVGSWTNLLHSRGTFDAWRRISSAQKWLRVHNTHEWNDLYNPVNVEDLRRFLDHIVKGVDNGWEATPSVRLTVLDPGHDDLLNRAESSFPLARGQFVKMHLDAADGTLGALPDSSASVTYLPDAEGVVFRHTFQTDTEITGYGKVRLWLSAEDADDLDVFVTLSKIGAKGEDLRARVVTGSVHNGLNGQLRASLREVDEERSTPAEPFHTFRTVQKLAPGEIVKLDIGLWPYSIRFHPGETLQLRVNGVGTHVRPEFSTLPPDPTINTGRHILHTGGEYDSHVLLPIVEG